MASLSVIYLPSYPKSVNESDAALDWHHDQANVSKPTHEFNEAGRRFDGQLSVIFPDIRFD
jgi:hypothetical protein